MPADEVMGKNGVAVRTSGTSGDGFRSYEVYQRERVGQSTEKIKPRQLVSEAYRTDPYPVLGTLREHYPCYRDWLGNRYWITRYDDVTSIFTDDANFETRSKRWFYGVPEYGRDFNSAVAVQRVEEEVCDTRAAEMTTRLIEALNANGGGNLATAFAAQLPLELLREMLALPQDQADRFDHAFWRAQRGVGWDPRLQADGRAALGELETIVEQLVAKRRQDAGEDMISAMLGEAEDLTARDVVATLLERDHETLHGALANLWRRLLADAQAREAVGSDRRLMKLAYLETLRHSPPVLSARRFARHEVERFGRLLPEGALLVCSAAAANRDPRVFDAPDTFVVDRRDLCQREPRGQYRADGLATGIAFGLGKPSRHPAVPEDRPRSRYAITRDTAVAASMALLDAAPGIRLARGHGDGEGAEPALAALTVGEMHTCWNLPVTV